MLEHELALLAFQIEKNHRLAFAQCMPDAQYASFQRRFVTIVGAVTGDEILYQAGEGIGFELVVRNQHGRSRINSRR